MHSNEPTTRAIDEVLNGTDNAFGLVGLVGLALASVVLIDHT